MNLLSEKEHKMNEKGQAEGTMGTTLGKVVKWAIRVLFFVIVVLGLYFLLNYLTT